MICNTTKDVRSALEAGENFILYNGDCRDLFDSVPTNSFDFTLTSPPYFMGKAYDRSYKLEDFIADHEEIAPEIAKLTKVGGNIAWQVGHHVKNGVDVPLDFPTYQAFSTIENLLLRNRIVWTFGHGVHATRRFSGRHETILWFSNGENYYFDLDAARVPQKYRGKTFYKGPKKGQLSSNPNGKNPGDVWDIPNVKANHVEKTAHPCQFPVALAQRLIRALSPTDGVVFDPFAGSGSTGIAAAIDGRMFVGAEISEEYCRIAQTRYEMLLNQKLQIRPLDKPVYEPDPNSKVARLPVTTNIFGSQ